MEPPVPRFASRSRVRTLLAAFLACGGLAAFASGPAHATDEPPEAGASAGARHAVGVVVDVQQRTPLRGTKVRLLATERATVRGKRVRRTVAIAPAQRTRSGATVFLLRRAPPRSFAIVAIGGRIGRRAFRGRLVARVRGHRSGDFVHVNPATTLLARYRTLHPRVRERVATNRVRRFLRIDAAFDLGHDVRFTRPGTLRMSGRVLVRRGQAAGGFNRYVTKLARQIHPRRKPVGPRFAPRRAVGRRAAGRRAAAVASAVGAPAGSAEAILMSALNGALSKAASAAGSAALSWIGSEVPFLSFLSGDGQLSEIQSELNRISQQLTQLQASVNELQSSVNQLEALVTQGTFATLNQQALQLVNAVDTSVTNITGFAQATQSGSATPASVSAAWTAVVGNIGRDLVDVPGEGTVSTLMSSYLSPPVGRGLLAWANLVPQYADVAGQQQLYTTDQSYVPLRTMLLYASAEAVAAQLEALYYRTPTTYGGAGIGSASACTAASTTPDCQLVAAAQSDLAAYPGEILPVLPDNALLDTQTGRMWITSVDSGASVSFSNCPQQTSCDYLFANSGSLGVNPEDAYAYAVPALTWNVSSSPLPLSDPSNAESPPVDGGDAAFRAATLADLKTLIPASPKVQGTGSAQGAVSVQRWLGAVGFAPTLPDLLLGDGTAPTYPVPIVRPWVVDPVFSVGTWLCTWGGSIGMANWTSYLVSFTDTDADAFPQPSCEEAEFGADARTTLPNAGQPDNRWLAGVNVGPSDIATAPWNAALDDALYRDSFVSVDDADRCATQGRLQRGASGYWQVAGTVAEGFEDFLWYSPGSMKTPPINWRAPGAALTFNVQAIDATRQSFPRAAYTGPVACGRPAGTMLLVRDAPAGYYTQPAGS